jgi:dissimilatory sulfite reductase related protein
MQVMQIGDQTAVFNPRGFLAHFTDWSRDLAVGIAREDGLALTECHWAVIDYMREFFGTHEIPPSPRVIIKDIGDQLVAAGGTCTRKSLEGLFPSGGCRQACRIAGLPDFYCHSC